MLHSLGVESIAFLHMQTAAITSIGGSEINVVMAYCLGQGFGSTQLENETCGVEVAAFRPAVHTS